MRSDLFNDFPPQPPPEGDKVGFSHLESSAFPGLWREIMFVIYPPLAGVQGVDHKVQYYKLPSAFEFINGVKYVSSTYG